MTIHANILPLAIAYWNSDSSNETAARLALVKAFEKQLWDGNSTITHGVSRSKAGDNIALAFSLTENTVLNRTVSADKRNQSFSVSTKSKRVKLGMVDKRMLRMRTDAEKMAKAAEYKRQNNRTPLDALQRIERKIVELLGKLEKAIRQARDTTAIDVLLVRCNYYRHREIVRLDELTIKAEERGAMPLIGSADATVKPVNLQNGHINLYGRTIPNGGINVSLDRLVELTPRPIIPASVGRSYKVKRKVLKDRPSQHGEAQEKVLLASGLVVSRVARSNGAHASKRKPGATKAAKLAAELARLNAKA